MKINMKMIPLLAGLVGICIASAQAQTVVAPDVGQARLQELQDLTPADAPLDGAAMSFRKIQLKASVGSGETWIPLGLFAYGTRHRLEISSLGAGANSNGVCEFSLHWNGNMVVHSLSQYNIQSHFQLYSYKVATRQGVALKYNNIAAPNNTVYVTYSSHRGGAWEDYQPEADFFATLTDSNLMRGALVQHSGRTYAGTSLAPGTSFNQTVNFNEPVSMKENLVFTDGAVLEGDVILEKAQGDISMGAFGN